MIGLVITMLMRSGLSILPNHPRLYFNDHCGECLFSRTKPEPRYIRLSTPELRHSGEQTGDSQVSRSRCSINIDFDSGIREP